MPARTVSRILRRHGVPYLHECDPITGEVIRSSKRTAVRYERDRPGELVHMDVKKLGKIPDGGGWKAHGRAATSDQRHKREKVGYDYIHSLIDDHSRLAYSEVLPDEKGPTCAGFLARAAAYFVSHGHHPDPAVDDRQRLGLPMVTARRVRRPRHRPEVHQAPLPLAERQGRTVQPHPGHRVGLPPTLHHQHRPHRRSCPLARALQH